LLRLWNVYSFFVIYANIDGFNPAAATEWSLPASSTMQSLTDWQRLSSGT
jgi:hypothetical protein